MKINRVCSTNGKGYWSSVAKPVFLKEMNIEQYSDSGIAELQIIFDTKTWTQRDGMIYSDPKFIVEFREVLISMGFTFDEARDIEYSEAGMQGKDYVSCDVGEMFLIGWTRLTEKSNKP